GGIAHLEALIRIHDRETGLMMPEAFIRVAEDTNLICELGLWVIATSCRQLQLWSAEGVHAKVSVNVSPLQLESEGFVESILRILSAHGVHPGSMAMEVTEQTLIR